MSVATFVPEISSVQVLQTLKKALVFPAVCSSAYDALIKGPGDRIRINIIAPLTANTYTPRSSTVTPEDLFTAPIFLDIDQDKTAAFDLEDYDKAVVAGDIVGPGNAELGYALNNIIDQYIASMYSQGQLVLAAGASLGTETTAIALTSLNFTEYVSMLAQAMNEANVPQDGRWIIGPPWFEQKGALAKINLDTSNTDIISNGFRGKYLGFNIFVSNNVSIKTAPATGCRIMAGYADTIAYGQKLVTVEALRSTTTMRDIVRAQMVYGAKVIRPETLAILRATFTAEP